MRQIEQLRCASAFAVRHLSDKIALLNFFRICKTIVKKYSYVIENNAYEKDR